jgi:hypothetical protein
MRKIKLNFPLNKIRQAAQHTAALFDSQIRESDGILLVDVATPIVNPSLTSGLKTEDWQGIDPTITLEILPLADGIIIRARRPLFYFTNTLGFTTDAESSFATTMQETLKALRDGTKLPKFPAPPRPPSSKST